MDETGFNSPTHCKAGKLIAIPLVLNGLNDFSLCRPGYTLDHSRNSLINAFCAYRRCYHASDADASYTIEKTRFLVEITDIRTLLLSQHIFVLIGKLGSFLSQIFFALLFGFCFRSGSLHVANNRSNIIIG